VRGAGDRHVTDARHWHGLDQPGLENLAIHAARALVPGMVLHLRGELGAGKTTFARALIRALAPGVRVKSPTYTLVETYALPRFALHHLDLYRLAAPDELEYLGVRELAAPDAVLVVEWPEKGGDALPRADLELALAHAGLRRDLDASAASATGAAVLTRLPNAPTR
jgi:tRNA threonylcarbamoyladenosine biosynthesis protein TsaE